MQQHYWMTMIQIMMVIIMMSILIRGELKTRNFELLNNIDIKILFLKKTRIILICNFIKRKQFGLQHKRQIYILESKKTLSKPFICSNCKINTKMILQHSFRKSFLISNPPLKPDEQPLQHLLPPEISPSSLIRTYSFSQLKNNQFSKEQSNDSIEATKNREIIDQLELKIKIIKSQLQQQKRNRIQALQDYRQLQKRYQVLAKSLAEQQEAKQEKEDFLKTIAQLQYQMSILKNEIVKKSEQLILFEQRNEQSRRLLQKLNENINKKQLKLIKDKQLVNKQLEETNKSFEEAKTQLLQYQNQIQQLTGKLQKNQLQKQQQITEKVQYKIKLIQQYHQNEIDKKNKQIQSLIDQIQHHKTQSLSQIQSFKEIITKQQLTMEQTTKIINELKSESQLKNHKINQLQSRNREFIQQIDQLQKNNQQLINQKDTILLTEKFKIQKLQTQILNAQYQIKDFQHKNSHYEQEIQKINTLINQLKDDKKLLNKEKQQLKTQIYQKNHEAQQLRVKLDQIKQVQFKYSALIQKYQKEQQRIYDQEAQATQNIATLQEKLKLNQIQIQNLCLKISQKQQEASKLSKELDRYKIMYKKQNETLLMYKRQIHSMKQKTQIKWNKLKVYYQTEIQNLEERVKELEILHINDSQINLSKLYQDIEKIMSSQKVQIVTSRLSINKQASRSAEDQQPESRLIDNFDSLATHKQKNHLRASSREQQLKQNYWHGLNHDSLTHPEEQTLKN